MVLTLPTPEGVTEVSHLLFFTIALLLWGRGWGELVKVIAWCKVLLIAMRRWHPFVWLIYYLGTRLGKSTYFPRSIEYRLHNHLFNLFYPFTHL